jgi:uncharacterized membrane protein
LATEHKNEEKPKIRLEALSDGMFAIIFTILVLELIIKDVHFENASAFKNHLIQLYPKFLSYLLSFAILAGFWLGHTEQFYYINRINRPFILTNVLFLFFISLIPFSTTLISEFTEFPLSVRVYGFNLLFCQFAFYLNWHSISYYQLHHQNLHRKIIRGHKKYIWIGLILDPIGIIATYVNALLGLIILALVPLIYLVLFANDKRSFSRLYLK